MKYAGMPFGMWAIFRPSFQKQLSETLQYSNADAKRITEDAAKRYRVIISSLPEFEAKDRFKMNIVSCAMLGSFLTALPEKPSVEDATAYYRNAMMIPAMHVFCRISGKKKFTASDIRSMKETAELKAADRNPYSWNMEFYPYDNDAGYEARFTKCGICVLMKELGLSDLVPAMCRLDYTTSEAGGASVFVREHTLAEGGPYCDCGYYRPEKYPSSGIAK